MNLSKLEAKLLESARANPPSDQVPYAFEKRITALLASRKVEDKSLFWSRALWRAAFSCLAVVLLLGVWLYLRPSPPASTDTADLSQDFRNTLTAQNDSPTTP
jgi:anti-sigma-K factor RskA